jgi:surface protein
MRDLFYEWRTGPKITRYEFNGDISQWDTSQVTTMRAMFNGAHAFNQPIGSWNTSKVSDMTETFYYAKAFNQDISGWDTSQVTRMHRTFNMAYVFNQDIGSWDTSLVTDMTYMFYQARAFNYDISSWTGTAATTAQVEMFRDAEAFRRKFTCADEFAGPVSSCECTGCIPDASWHSFVSQCLAIDPQYGLCTTWDKYSTYGAMPDWDTSLVEDMTGYGANGFKGFGDKNLFNADISKWDTRRVTDMHDMFYGCTAFNQDIGNWNTSQVKDMYAMFAKASAFNQDIGSWNTEKVTRMNSMFDNAHAFNQDIGNWNTEKVTTMTYMFHRAYAFNYDISSWNGTAAKTAQLYMFASATAFQAKFTCDDANHGPAESCE